jgi:hypothetical protein
MSNGKSDHVQFRMKNQEELEKRAVDGMRSKDLTARRDLNRYYMLLEEITPSFPKKEALTIVAVHNSPMVQDMRMHARLLHANVEDGPEMYVEGHGVDREELVEKIKALSFPEKVAAMDAIERYWNDQELTVEDVGLLEDSGRDASSNGQVKDELEG